MKHHTRKLQTIPTDEMCSASHPTLHFTPKLCFHFNTDEKKEYLSILEVIELNIMQTRNTPYKAALPTPYILLPIPGMLVLYNDPQWTHGTHSCNFNYIKLG